MAVATVSKTVAVATTAVRLDTGGRFAATGAIAIYNSGAGTVWIGGSNVTTSNGIPVAVSTLGPSFDLTAWDAIYAISDTSATVRVLESGLGYA